MTRRELILAALDHRETRPIPWDIGFTTQAHDALIAHTGDADIAAKFESCIATAYSSGWPTEIPGRPEYYIDAFGVVWNRTGVDKDIGVVDEYLIKDIEDHNYVFPPCDTGRFRRAIEETMAHKGDRAAFVGIGFTMFERAWSLAGMENILAAMVTAPEALHALLDRICDAMLSLVDVALEFEIDAVHFGDDWGQQKGLIMGPDHWRCFIKPRMARLYARARSKGAYITQHSCGDCHEIFPDLIDIGLNAYQTFQPEIYDIDEMKRLYGDKLTFWGGISTQRCLPFMKPDAVRGEVVRIARALRRGGGLILAPTHSIPGDVPPENILAVADVLLHQERYL